MRRHDGTVDIDVTRGDTAPCIQGLTITRDGTDIAQSPPVWAISTSAEARCRTSFVYGRIPDGWSQGRAAPPLTVGAKYLVEVAGPGLLGGRTFTMRSDDGSM